MGQGDDGTVYIAVSNHDEVAGNVAIFALDPGTNRIRLLGDLKLVSTAAGNWRNGESHYKVHTFLQKASDGLIYFATMGSGRPKRDRGAHGYALDPRIEEIPDVSLAAPFSIASTRKVGPGSGVVVQQLGVKGMGLQPDFTDVLYLMTWGAWRTASVRLAHGIFTAWAIRRVFLRYFTWMERGDVYSPGGPPNEPQPFLFYDVQTGEASALV